MKLRALRSTAIAHSSQSLRNAALYPKLALNFLSEQLDPRITFSRSSNATYFDSTGTLRYAPHNLLTYSEQLDNSAWTKTRTTATANGIAAPDGTLTADKLVEDTSASTSHYAQSVIITPLSGTSYTGSVYIKAAERRYVAVTMTGGGGADRGVFFDAQTGTHTGGFAGGLPYAIENVGGGWYRFSILDVTTAAASYALRIYVCDSVNNITYTGDGTSGVYVWGAQLNVGTLQPYYSTTVKNQVGYTQEFDNAAWTKTNSFVQTNSIRNNTMQGAVAGTPGTLPTNWGLGGISGGLASQVVGTGLEDGINYIDIRISGTNSSGSAAFPGVFFDTTTGIAGTTGQIWNESLYLKLVEGAAPVFDVSLHEADSGGVFLRSSSVVGASGLPTTGTLSSKRRSGFITLGASTAFIRPLIATTVANGATVDFTIRIGWPQLVRGAVAGDPVPTYGTARAVMYAAPDRSLTADKFAESAGTGPKQLYQSASWVSGTRYAWSIYARAAERSFLYFYGGSVVFPAGGVEGYVNLNTGAVSNVGANCVITATNVGNGWWRCCIFATAGATASNPGIDIRISANGSDSGSYTGDGTSGIYVWGAQQSNSASLDAYTYNPVAAPSNAAYYGHRLEYDPTTLAWRGLLIEEQRTNLILNSQNITLTTWGSNGNVTANVNSGVSPDGTQNATAVMETTTNNTHTIGQTFNITANTSYAASIYLKANGRDQAIVYYGMTGTPFTRIGIRVNLSTGLFVNSDIGTPSSVTVRSLTPVGNGWYRVVIAGIAETTTTAGLLEIRFYNGTTTNYAGDPTKGMFVWGGQVEAGAFATSYVPTTTTALTRSADVALMQGANFSNWYNPVEGTLFAEFGPYENGGATKNFGIVQIDDGTSNNMIRFFAGSTVSPVFQVTAGAATQAYLSSETIANTSISKISGAYKTDDFARSVNGTAATTDTAGSVPPVTRMIFGMGSIGVNELNGYLRSFSYYPSRLPNATLRALTS